MVMDEIFGVDKFQREIIWDLGNASGFKMQARNWIRGHDTILFYVKSKNFIFNKEFIPYSKEDLALYPEKQERRGLAVTDTWKDIASAQKWGKAKAQHTGYPTEKPVKLLERIILASSNEGNLILDPFCGCGTTILAAQKLNRRWIGIDINRTAYDTTKGREQQLPLGTTEGFATANYVSRDLEEVKGLSPNEFEYWVNEYHRAYHPSPDRGIDGITKDGVPIQTKTWKVGYSVLDKLLSSAQIHPEVPQPVKKMIIVSQIGFDDSARATKFAIETKFGIEVELKIPEDLLE